MNKNVLVKELNLIQDPLIKEWTSKTLANAPDYFYVAQASSTGKYHPSCTLGDGGLIVHVQRAVFFANRLCGMFGFDQHNIDIVISATILHDIAKVGRGFGSMDDYTNHPLNAEKYFAKDCELNKEPNQTTTSIINNCIRLHMSRWSPEEVLIPLEDYSLVELCVTLADYLATTKEVQTSEDNKR